MRFITRVLPTVILIVVPTAFATADVPTSMHIQGRLTDSTGAPLPVLSRDFTFKIYDMEEGGNLVWPDPLGETQAITADANGVWNALVGATIPVPDSVMNNSERWLEISIVDNAKGTTPTVLPRIRFFTAPFAYRVSTIDGASGGNITSKVSIGPKHANPGQFAFVAGDSGTATGDWSTVSGGYGCTASGPYSTVGGGYINTADSNRSVVAGGTGNLAGNYGSAVGGGQNNVAVGRFSPIAGGWGNRAAGEYSFAAGRNGKANHDGAIVFAGNSVSDFESTQPNQFLIKAPGGVGIGTNSPNAQLDVVSISSNTIATFLTSGDYSYVNFGHTGAGARTWALHTGVGGTGTGKFSLLDVDAFQNRLVIDTLGNIGIGTDTPGYRLDVRGTIGDNATMYHSDRRWKTKIKPLESSLERVQQLQGVHYEWKRAAFPEMNFPAGVEIGVIAQDVERVIPEVVSTSTDGFKSVDYARLVAVLIEGMKEQQKQIEDLKDALERMSQ